MAADELAAELSLLIRFGSLAAALDLISVVEPASPADRKRPYVHHSRLGSSWPKAAGPLWSNPAGKAASITPRDTVRSDRSEERRVGEECVNTCRSRWSPSH